MIETEEAALGEGCFWRLERALRELGGVIDSRVG